MPPTLKTDRELSGLMERPASSPFAVEVNDEDEDDVGRVLCDSDDACMSCCVDFWCICCAGDVVLLSDECEFSICSFNA